MSDNVPNVVHRIDEPEKFCKIVETSHGAQVLFVKARHPTNKKYMIHVSTYVDKFGVVALTFDFPDLATRERRFAETETNDADEARKLLFQRCLTHGKPE